MKKKMKIKQQEVHYYGIISGIAKKIGLIDEIDRITKSDPQKKVSNGQCVLAMILNGMGLTMSKPMYLVSEFFRNKSTEILIGNGITPDDLNDDTLGRTLDAIYESGASTIFSSVALKAVKVYAIATSHLHGDTTNVQVYGDYDEGGDLIVFGYHKQGRSDLKQYMLSLITTSDGAVPLFAHALRGNTSDIKHFKDLIALVEENIVGKEGDTYFILDSALYCIENLKTIDKVLIITRVPERISAAKEAKEAYVDSIEQMDGDDDYKFAEICSIYADVRQRWVVVYSRAAHEREKKTIKALVLKEKTTIEKELIKFRKKTFACESDAKSAIDSFSKQYKFHKIIITKINEKEQQRDCAECHAETDKKSFFTVDANFEELSGYIERKIRLGSMFVLATTQLDENKLPTKAVLSEYKGQSPLENRFNLIKNATCIASKVYLKKESRIVALAMIICLMLLIYSLAERAIRKALAEQNKTVPHQSGRPIQNPTMKWIFQMFEGVGFVTIQTGNGIIQEITNLRAVLKEILCLLGEECMSFYLLTPTG